MRAALLALLLVLLALPARALTPDQVPNPRERDSWVADTADLLSPEAEARLDRQLDELESLNGCEVAVVTVQDTRGLEPKPFATALFNRWGIGKKGLNNGVLFLVVPARRRVELEVGDGVRTVLSDGRSKDILEQSVVPRFKAGDYEAGIEAGVGAAVAQLRPRKVTVEGSVLLPEAPPQVPQQTPQPQPEPQPAPPTGLPSWVPLGALGVLLLGVLAKYRRLRPRRCPACQGRMVRLDEQADDARLGEDERLEERLGSVDYDVWVCSQCGQSTTSAHPAWITNYSTCPSCSRRTFTTDDVVLESATTSSEGRGKRLHRCCRCSYRREDFYTIPRVQESSSSSSSSDSSTGSSSFGGGSSSGGGAGASW